MTLTNTLLLRGTLFHIRSPALRYDRLGHPHFVDEDVNTEREGGPRLGRSPGQLSLNAPPPPCSLGPLEFGGHPLAEWPAEGQLCMGRPLGMSLLGLPACS